MSYERVRIKEVRHFEAKDGKRHCFLSVEVLQNQDIYMNDDALKHLPLFESLIGQECLLPLSWGERNGKPNLSFDGEPIPLAIPSASSVPQFASGRVDTTTGEIKPPEKPAEAKPLFGKTP